MLAFCLLVGAGAPPSAAFDLEKPIKDIRVEGNQRANTNTIRFYIRSKQGDKYSVKETRDDIRRIFNLGYFDDIRLEVEEMADGLALVYVVKEKPFIKSVTVKGNTEIPEKDMLVLINLKKGSFYQQHVVLKDIQRIKKKYLKKGFYFTEIATTSKDAGNNQVDVTYNVQEKQKVKIGRVIFRGNRFFADHKLLDQMESKGANFWTMFTDSGNYQKETLKTDVLRIEALYRDFGFIKARLEDPRVEVDRENAIILITIVIHEGDQYRVGEITAEGDSVHTAEEILAKVQLKKGEPFNQSEFRTSLFDITDLYSNDGYAFANALPDLNEHADTKVVDLHVKVDPGQMVYIGKMNFMGNTKTADNVIRREFRLVEGERFSGEKLNRSRQRVQNTGFFANVDIEQKSGREPGILDLDVNMNEKETGQIKAGLGYSSLENLMIQAQITENNLMGTGRSLSVGAESSTLRQDYYIEFMEPRFKDRDISLGFSIYSRQYDYISYTSKTKGGGFTFGRALGEYTSASLGYRLENVEVAINRSLITPGAFLQAQEGTRTTSSATLAVAKDTRDNTYNPTTGYRTNFAAQLAGGPLGGESDFYKLTLGGSRYYPLPFGFILMGHGEMKYAAPYGGQTLPIFEHLFLGGPTSLRGFNFSDVGPRDTNRESIGGDSSLLFNVEVSYNFTKTFEGVVFYDRGQVYGHEGDLTKTTSDRYDLSNMRHSVGWGLRLTTPMMPIWLAWGFKLDRQPDEGAMEFHFTMGRTF
ncbi:MAG: outer membrane protein assembly factor BamA [Nitrospinae bacterium]|nr:outer membrane protein assembly factor BamA [Nitrospinota bacterium]